MRNLCLFCGAGDMRAVEGFAQLPRITSDCKPFPPGGTLYTCMSCGCVQKLPDAKWLQEW